MRERLSYDDRQDGAIDTTCTVCGKTRAMTHPQSICESCRQPKHYRIEVLVLDTWYRYDEEEDGWTLDAARRFVTGFFAPDELLGPEAAVRIVDSRDGRVVRTDRREAEK